MVEVKGSEKDGYTIVNKKQQLESSGVKKPSPKTGDSNKLFVYITLIGLSIISLIVLKNIKKKV
ncbi:sortase B cell surface sorting signal [Eggerthia catenaformis OT 569 = DSM 20559]|uniref:Sortase B cell surface sorting signal n=1 Tax=Eggerthia catenaformis OT 569 = DSM 20559 TaxID=999415 RepID=M2PLL2_9FIRM|nr:sortase B cell surface sorting signal [Eggerthia catenaformis OT 569 = DSM 20559]